MACNCISRVEKLIKEKTNERVVVLIQVSVFHRVLRW